MFLLKVLPRLSVIAAPYSSSPPREPERIVRALDCGAGIGRVAGDVLVHLCDRIDLVDPVAHFLKVANEKAPSWARVAAGKAGIRTFCEGLQNFDPRSPDTSTLSPQTPTGPRSDYGPPYDVIWMQWVTGHLDDDDLVEFLKRCKESLVQEDGVIIIKDNVTSYLVTESIFDERDSTIIRSEKDTLDIFERAGLKVIREQIQGGFPEDIHTVKM